MKTHVRYFLIDKTWYLQYPNGCTCRFGGRLWEPVPWIGF
jgi:hypothetical protein